jgi:hypothetical protein
MTELGIVSKALEFGREARTCASSILIDHLSVRIYKSAIDRSIIVQLLQWRYYEYVSNLSFSVIECDGNSALAQPESQEEMEDFALSISLAYTCGQGSRMCTIEHRPRRRSRSNLAAARVSANTLCMGLFAIR